MNFIQLLNRYQYHEEGMETYIEEAINIGYRKTMRTLPFGVAGTLLAMFFFFFGEIRYFTGIVFYVFCGVVILSIGWALLGILDGKRAVFSKERKILHSLFSFTISLAVGWISYQMLPRTNGMETTIIVVWLFVLMIFASFADYATPRILYTWSIGLSVFSVAFFIEDGSFGLARIIVLYIAMMSFIIYGNYSIYNDFIRQHVYKAKASLEYEKIVDYQFTHDLTTGLLNQNYLDTAIAEVSGNKSGMLILIQILNDADLIMLLGFEKRNEFITKFFSSAEDINDRVGAKVGSNTYAILTIETGFSPVEFLEMVQKGGEEVDYTGFNIDLQFRIGARVFSEDESLEKLFDQAHIALYSNQETVDRKWHIYEPSLEEEIIDRLKLAMDIDEGITENHFLMYYQPQVDAVTEEIVSFEALIRW